MGCTETIHWLVYTPSLELYLVTIDADESSPSNVYIAVRKVSKVEVLSEVMAVHSNSVGLTFAFPHTKQNDIGFIDYVKKLLESSTLVMESIERYCEEGE